MLCTKIKTYKFCSTAALLGQVITRAIPHRSINFRISQLFTQFPLIWFSNFEFLEPRKLIFLFKLYTFSLPFLPVENCHPEQPHHSPPHSISYAPGAAHTITNSVLKNTVLESKVYRSIIKDTQHPTFFFIKNFITQMYYCTAISRTTIVYYQIQSQHIFATMMVLFTN